MLIFSSKMIKNLILLKKNIKISGMGQGKLRIVTHLGYTNEMHERFLEILNDYK